MLVQSEFVHLLQRALMAGRIEARHGESTREVTANSNPLLLTNIVMAWNTQAMQPVSDNAPSGVFPRTIWRTSRRLRSSASTCRAKCILTSKTMPISFNHHAERLGRNEKCTISMIGHFLGDANPLTKLISSLPLL